jgi:5,5'-dehydrodivanillate O-demethylase oxygenase subunit
MLSAEDNVTLTRVGPCTPMGELQRRYWHAIGGVDEMKDRWTKRVRLLGEDLVLYKDRTGKFGLIGAQCPHRRASMAYGIPTEDGIRCPYHGWKFDATGACTEQPNEPEGSTFKDKVSLPGYPVEVLGGMLFAYLGPAPAPLLPRWDGFGSGLRSIAWAEVPCNWLQVMENSLDPVHTEWLHGKLQEFVEEKKGNTYAISRKHLKIDFAEFEYGIYKRRLLEGSSEDSDDWKVGHPVLFPNILAVGSGGGKLWKMCAYQIRVPMDDTHTMHYWYTSYAPPAGVEVPQYLRDEVPFFEMPYKDENGEYLLDLIDAQDVMAWITQGDIAKRDLERLGTTDKGIIHFRNMLKREMAKIAAGEDPMGTFRDPAKNELVEIALEKNKAHFTDGFENLGRRAQIRYSPTFPALCKVFSDYSEAKMRELPPLLIGDQKSVVGATTGE